MIWTLWNYDCPVGAQLFPVILEIVYLAFFGRGSDHAPIFTAPTRIPLARRHDEMRQSGYILRISIDS